MEGTFRVLDHWNTGFNGEITLTNVTGEVIHDWEVAFDLPYEISGMWNGVVVSHENGVYTVRNAGYNWDIQPGGSVTFGFCAIAETETVTEPMGYALVERQAGVLEGNLEVTYKVHGDWGTGFNGQIEVRNLSSEVVHDWSLEFDYPHTVLQFGNAEITSHEGDHYILKNKGHNADIEAGQTLTLDFTAECGGAGSGVGPTDCKVHSVSVE